jgi:lipopolysaccharide/colanic/teichoic acid biosynthesis glycosyltransferase
LIGSATARYPASALLELGESAGGILLILIGSLVCVTLLSARGAYAPRILLTWRHQLATIFTAVVPAWALVQLLAFWLKVGVPFESRLVVGLSLPATLLLMGVIRLTVTRPLAVRLYPRLAGGPATVAGDDLDEVFDEAFARLDAKHEVRIVSPRLETLATRAPLGDEEGVPVLPLRRPDLAGPERVIKRWIDVVGAVMGLVLLSPFLAIVAILIKLDSPGPVLFRQDRVGYRGRRFRMMKFRTMADGNDPKAHEAYLKDFIRGGAAAAVSEDGTQIFKLTNDSRITRFGAWLRRYSVDELPQLWNVLRGEMSLVGPRPCTVYEWELYRPWQRRRMDVAPGCTGLWQVSGRSSVNFEEMILLDLHYAHHWTPVGDLWLIAQTIPAMIRGRGGF